MIEELDKDFKQQFPTYTKATFDNPKNIIEDFEKPPTYAEILEYMHKRDIVIMRHTVNAMEMCDEIEKIIKK